MKRYNDGSVTYNSGEGETEPLDEEGNHVIIDDSNSGMYRVVGPFPDGFAARCWADDLELLISQDPFLKKRIIVELAKIESPDECRAEFCRLIQRNRTGEG